ncbi:hypothetical protein PG999_004121 [Apiospora kogelbergensis]|uniref:DUF3669 domain-containing protein n=1 Tax=Apiospora kogelbergensis TaxID=1337665 RepID=A0AAW0R5C9_9PEZI
MIPKQDVPKQDVFAEQSLVQQPYRRIGAGFCGSVWSPDFTTTSTTVAIKREDGGPGRSLLNDYNIHQTIIQSLESCPLELRTFTVPQCLAFVPKEHPGWQDGKVLARFPPGYEACNILISERIPPMPADVRNRIIDKFCPSNPPSLPDQIRADDKNRDCLVRPYLGRSKHGRDQSRISFFSLRNCPLHVDQMYDLGLSPKDYSSAMAKTLAFLHWGAKIDANDIEFVLAPGNSAPQFSSTFLGGHSLWILDFDCCKPLSLDDAGVEQAARAFLKNDPFYPRPGRTNSYGLWEEFRSEFLQYSRLILDSQDLPTKLMDRIEELVGEKESAEGS